MRSRTLALLWLLLAGALWCALFDAYMRRAAADYLREHALFELHRLDHDPSMVIMMAAARRYSALLASIWAGLVLALGWMTVWLRGGSRPRMGARGSL
jgi:hypothetical protein